MQRAASSKRHDAMPGGGEVCVCMNVCARRFTQSIGRHLFGTRRHGAITALLYVCMYGCTDSTPIDVREKTGGTVRLHRTAANGIFLLVQGPVNRRRNTASLAETPKSAELRRPRLTGSRKQVLFRAVLRCAAPDCCFSDERYAA